jgi:hypothetical protein
MAIPQSNNQYEPRSVHVAHFQALEQTCRLRQLSRSGGKYFSVTGGNQGHSRYFFKMLFSLVLAPC